MNVEQVISSLVAEKKINDPAGPKGKILTAAANLFREKGYAATTVRDIAALVGIQSGSLFHHYKSKQEILYTIMDDVVTVMDESIYQALMEAQSLKDKIKALVHCELEFVHSEISSPANVLVYEWKQLNETDQKKILKKRRHYFEFWEQTLAEAKKQGLTNIEPEYLRQLIHGALVWTIYWYNPAGKLPLNELVDRVYKLIVKED